MGGLANVAQGVGRSVGFGTGASRPKGTDLSPTFTAGGLSTDIGDSGRITVFSSGERRRRISELANIFGGTAEELSGIRELTRPGFSAFREAGLGQIENRRTAAVGNLRDNLARRRVLGSSFGQDTVARTEAEFAQEAGQFAAATTLQELDTFRALTERISEFQQNEVLTFLNEMNLQVDVARGLQAGAQQAISAASTVQQQNAGSFQRMLLDTAGTFGLAGFLS